MSIEQSDSTEQHAALMDRIYRHQRHFYDLTRRHYLLGRTTMLAGLDPPGGAAILEIGCGTAWNMIEAARRNSTCRGYGLDVSQEMLATAAAKVAKAGLVGRLSLAQADAVDFDAVRLFGRATFDRVFISYSLSMIPAWREVIERAMHAVAPGGSLHVVDFGRLDGLPRIGRRALLKWLDWFSVHPRRDLEPTLARAAAKFDFEFEVDPLYRGYAIIAVLRRRAARPVVSVEGPAPDLSTAVSPAAPSPAP